MTILIRFLAKIVARRVIFILIPAFITGFGNQYSYGQSNNELRKLWKNDNLLFLAENQQDKLFSISDFYKFSQTRDDGFADYLKETWHDFPISPGLSEISLKQTLEKPVFNSSDFVNNPPANLPYSKAIGSNYNLSGQVKMIPGIRKPDSDLFTSVKGIFRFYGQQISINYDLLLTVSKINSVSEDSISIFWKSFARSNTYHLVDQLMDNRDLLGLGDWGYFQLVKATSNFIFANNPVNADLLTWALMIRSGYDVRLAYNQNSTTVLFPCENTIYNRQYVAIGQTRFYLDREMKSQLLVTCRNPFPENYKMIDLKFYKSLNFGGKLIARKFLYPWNNSNHEFSLRYNPEVIRFYKDYPQTDPLVYFDAPVVSTLKEDLLGQFYPVLSKMGKAEGTAFLQQFVQKMFDYTSVNQKDEENINRFAEQVIATKMGDDKSKSTLFSWLIRILLRSPVVGVQFPGFYSVAVGFETPLDGDFYYYNHVKYYIADPTFHNAPIGISMPEFVGLTPRLIDLSGSFSQPDKALEIWKLASKMGAHRGGTCQDVIFDRLGRSLITGYFTDEITCHPFIACFSQGNSLQWIRKFEGDGEAVAFAITKLSDDEIYIAGSFSGEIKMNGSVVQSGSDNADLFIAQFNQNGELIWINNAGIDSTAQNESLAYMVKFDRSGKNISTHWSNEDKRNIKNGFGNLVETGLYFTGTGSRTPGMVPRLWNNYISDIPAEFVKEYNLLIKNKCHPQMAGIVAVMKVLKKTGTVVTGNQLQKWIVRMNPSFQVNNTDLFKNIRQIKQFKNENGILSLRTIDGKSLVFNNLKVEDGAKFNLSFFGNGDLSLGIISGLKKVSRQVAMPLNSILFDISSGNMVIDFDQDHTIKTTSLGIIPSPR